MAAKKRSTKKETASAPVEHGLKTACYSNDGLSFKPLIICLCGWSSGRGDCFDWEEAGASFDMHLREMRS
jgi:hypothetical protein